MKFYLAKKNRQSGHRHAGFTFLEVMIVVAIIGILTAITIISFGPISKRTKLNASADAVASTLNLARGYALQGRMPIGRTSICGYSFKFTSTTQYQIAYYYSSAFDANGNMDCSNLANITSVIVSTQDLKLGTVLNTPAPGATATIYFSIPSALVVFPIANPNFNIIYSGTPSLQKTITVSTNGLIQ